MLLGGAVFGGVHLVAWKLVFPTPIEQILWRISSLITMLGPLIYVLLEGASLWLFQQLQGRATQSHKDDCGTALFNLSVLAIVLARLFVIVQAFRSLYYLPQDAYFTTWVSNAPYIA